MAKSSSNWTARTLPQIAAFFGVEATTVRNDWRQNSMPGKPGAYDLKDVFDWWRAREGKKRQPRAESESESEWKKYRALKAEAEYRKMVGELVEQERLSTALLRFATAVKAKAYALIPGLAAELEGLDEKQRLVSITQHIEDYLRGLALEFRGHNQTETTRKKPIKTGRPRGTRRRA